jgi:hypothetical protein
MGAPVGCFGKLRLYDKGLYDNDAVYFALVGQLLWGVVTDNPVSAHYEKSLSEQPTYAS